MHQSQEIAESLQDAQDFRVGQLSPAPLISVPRPRLPGPTVLLPLPVGEVHLQRLTVDCQRINMGDLQFETCPAPSSIRYWKTKFKTELCSCSGHPSEAKPWIREMELAHATDDLQSSFSTTERIYPNLETLDAKIAIALKRIINDTHIKKKVFI